MIRVVVVDNEVLIRRWFQRILEAEDDLSVVGTAGGGNAVEVILAQQPDVVLLDIRMPDVDGLAVLRETGEMAEPPAVCMLTAFGTDMYVEKALRLGASGFLLKDTDPAYLAPAVRMLADGGLTLSPRVTRSVVDEYLGARHRRSSGSPIARLTGHERSVLQLLAEGHSNAQIGARLHMSVGSVKERISSVFAKLKVENRVQAAVVAERSGLLDTAPGS